MTKEHDNATSPLTVEVTMSAADVSLIRALALVAGRAPDDVAGTLLRLAYDAVARRGLAHVAGVRVQGTLFGGDLSQAARRQRSAGAATRRRASRPAAGERAYEAEDA